MSTAVDEGSKSAWPDKAAVLQSLGQVSAWHDLFGGLGTGDLRKFVEGVPVARSDVLSLIGLRRSTGKLNDPMLRRLLELLRTSTDPSVYKRLFRSFVPLLRAVLPKDAAEGREAGSEWRREWVAFLTDGESTLEVHAPGGELIPVRTAVEMCAGLGRIGFGVPLAAIESEQAHVPMMALAAVGIGHVEGAYRALRENFPDMPPIPSGLWPTGENRPAEDEGMPNHHKSGMAAAPAVINPESEAEEASTMDANHHGAVEAAPADPSGSVTALDWTGAAVVAQRVADKLERECAPETEDLDYLQNFLTRANYVAHEVGLALGEKVATTRASLEEALLRRAALESPEGRVLKAMAGVTGPTEHADSINRVAELSRGALVSMEPAHLIEGIMALYELASAGRASLEGSAFDWTRMPEWSARIIEGLPTETHPLIGVASLGGLVPVEGGHSVAVLDPELALPDGVQDDSPLEPAESPVEAEWEAVSDPHPPEEVAEPAPDQDSTEVDEDPVRESLDPELAAAALSEGVAGNDSPRPEGEAGAVESPQDSAEPDVWDENRADDEKCGEQSPVPAPDAAQVQPRRGKSDDVTEQEAVDPSDGESLLVGESAVVGELPSDPWKMPTPSLYATLVSQNREGLAYHVAKHLEPGAARSKALATFVGAFGVKSERLILDLPNIAPDSAEISQLGADEARVFLAAQLRLALELGYSPIGTLDALREQAALDTSIGEVIGEAVSLATRGYRRRHDEGNGPLPADWQDIKERAEASIVSLSKKRISYQRSSQIIHYLARDNEALGLALRAVARVADSRFQGRGEDREDWGILAEVLKQIRRHGGPERLIDHADQKVSTQQQRRNKIVADAITKLHEAIEEVAGLLEEALRLRDDHDQSIEANPGVDDSRLRALVNGLEGEDVTTAGSAAITRVLDWFSGVNDVGSAQEVSFARLEDGVLDACFEIPRDEEGRPDRVATEEELVALIDGRPHADVVAGYLHLGNRAAATRYHDVHGEADDSETSDNILRSLSVLRQAHNEAVSRADRVIARLRSLGEDEQARSLLDRVDSLREADEQRFDLAFGPLLEAAEEGERVLAAVRLGLRERTDRLPEAARLRILALLEQREEPLAVEYLTLAEADDELPTIEPPPGDDFASFFPAYVERSFENLGPKSETVRAVRQSLGLDETPSNPVMADGMKAWLELARFQQGNDRAARIRRISDVLRMLGLIPHPEPRLKDVAKTHRAGFATFSVRANPIGDASHVPSFGSQAGGLYHLTLVWQEVSPLRLLQLVHEDHRSHANIILYFGTLSVSDRLEIRRLTTRSGTDYSPLVIDDAVVAWLSQQPEAGWKLTQRVTLPFTTINPYTPFAGGEVPAEMFVGREDERRRIIDPTGPLFVYGGRQLGKSALLRRIERGMAGKGPRDEADSLAIYLDLKAAGIGEASPPDALWQVLAPKLVDIGVLQQKKTWSANNVTSGINDWLQKDDSRRLLLLLDEADSFLTADARDSGPTGRGEFPTLQRLKGLMETTARRFKPVFAGLHQVQRFHALPNTPVAHGGRDILIGPLRPIDAQQLVRDPMYALGYEFETDETIWRLLLFTNYQASLIQIICEALIRHVRSTPLPSAGGRAVITDKHVDEVYNDREVRNLIAQRFRWTINLDSRYRMIALVTAFRSFGSVAGGTFRANDLQNECEDYWPEGFAKSNLSSDEFARYLEEMTGLGVLHRQDDQFGLRSPNIRSLLGSKSDIEDELLEASRNFQVGYEYNPTLNRRQLSDGPSMGQQRSPLPDGDLANLINGTHVVVGTSALGIDRVRRSIDLLARERQLELLSTQPPNRAQGRIHVPPVLRASDLPDMYRQAIGSGAACVLVVSAAEAEKHMALIGDRVLQVKRWSLSALQSWPESPFESIQQRTELKNVTGGWPELVESAMKHVQSGSTPEDALNKVRAELTEPNLARAFIESLDVPLPLLRTWLDWFADTDESGRVESHTFRAEDLGAAGIKGDSDEVIRSLRLRDVLDETTDGLVMNEAVLRAASVVVG